MRLRRQGGTPLVKTENNDALTAIPSPRLLDYYKVMSSIEWLAELT